MKRPFVIAFTSLMLGVSCAPPADYNLSIQLLSGQEIQITGPRDKPLYLKFWASWCGQCLAQMPHLQSIYATHGEDIDVVAVNFGFNDTPEQIGQVQQKMNLTLPIAYDESGEITHTFDVGVVPYSVIIDRDGSIVHSNFGDSDVDEKITALLKESL